MPRFTSAAKAVVGRLATRRNISKQWISYSKNNCELGYNYAQIRWLSSIDKSIGGAQRRRVNFSRSESVCSSSASFIQKRAFLGVGDGEEGNALSKVYEEKRVLGYSPEQLFAVVAGVDLYEDFLPWCQRSEITRHYPDGSFDAELEIGFKFLVESYVSHVELTKPNYVKTTSSQSSLFDHLINVWKFNPGPTPGTCNLYFLVDFKFHSPFYRQVANMFFEEVASRLVGSFHDRCRLIYGPGIPVLENSYEQRA